MLAKSKYYFSTSSSTLLLLDWYIISRMDFFSGSELKKMKQFIMCDPCDFDHPELGMLRQQVVQSLHCNLRNNRNSGNMHKKCVSYPLGSYWNFCTCNYFL